MSKNLSAKYYQEIKERLPKKACKRYQNPSKVEKEKSNNLHIYIYIYIYIYNIDSGT